MLCVRYGSTWGSLTEPMETEEERKKGRETEDVVNPMVKSSFCQASPAHPEISRAATKENCRRTEVYVCACVCMYVCVCVMCMRPASESAVILFLFFGLYRSAILFLRLFNDRSQCVYLRGNRERERERETYFECVSHSFKITARGL